MLNKKIRLIMKKVLFLLLAFCCLVNIAQKKKHKYSKTINGKEIIGYYPGWQVYDRNKIARPSELNYRKFTTIIYAFFRPDFQGNIKGSDAFIDDLVLKGERDWRVHEDKAYIPATGLVELAHYKKVKVFISVGGWTFSRHFSQIAADSTKRKRFAESCVKLVKEYDIDGIDIDWEFPGTNMNGNITDIESFPLLLKEVRTALDEYEATLKRRKKKHIHLVIATSASKMHTKNLKWKNILPYIDHINLMTYDFTGSWTLSNGAKSPIYGNTESCIDSAVQHYKNELLIPDSMLTIGTSFNGNAMKCNKGKVALGEQNSGSYNTKLFKDDRGQPTYYSIMLQHHLFTEKWDYLAHQPYLLSDSLQTFVTYDNEKAVREKVKYVKQENLHGIFIWDITGDIIETRKGSGFIKKTPLIDAVFKEMKE